MDIQKLSDQDLDQAQQHQPQQNLPALSMMPMPDMGPAGGAPRSNPLAMIWRRRGVLAIVLLVCVGAAMVKYYVSARIYRSEAQLFVQVPTQRGGIEVAGGASANKLQTQCELIKSTHVLAEVVGHPEMARLKTFASGQKFSTLRENLSATVGKDTDLITLTFDSPYPKEARAVLQAVVDAYSSFFTKEKRSDLMRLEKWRNEKQLALDKRQKELVALRQKHGELSFAGDKGLAHSKLRMLEEATDTAFRESRNLKTDLETAKALLSDPSKLRQQIEYMRSTGALTNTDVNEAALRSQLMAMEQQLDELRRRYLPEHPAIRAAEATVASIRARIGDVERGMAEAHVLALEQRYASSKKREAEFQQALEQEKKVALDLNAKRVEIDQVEVEVKRLADIVEKADMQIITLSASETVGVPVIQVFNEPSEPGAPIKPNQQSMLFQGLMLGLILGCFAALVRDWTDQGLRNADEVTQTLGVPLLGAVPHMPGPPNPLASGRKVDLEPASDVAESYRTIRTAVFFGTPERESRTILVTSPAPGEGKSTFASNLAIAMAQTGKRVILVDCDFRRPVQQRVFECRPGAGLSTVLTGKDALDQAIQTSGIASLDILPCGPVPSNPAEILNSQSFAEVLEELSVRYEHVVIDSPPVMAFADARILAAMCSVTILVVRANQSTRKAAVHARKALLSVGAHILGAVVNDVPHSQDRYGDYGESGGYRARYTGGSSAASSTRETGSDNGYSVPPVERPASGAIIPAKSFLDLRRK